MQHKNASGCHTFIQYSSVFGNPPFMISADTTFTASWTPNTYTVTFYSNGGTGSMPSQSFTYGVAQKISKNLFTYEGYRFVGWATWSSATSASYTDEQEYTIGSSNQSFYAIWEEVRHNLTLTVTPEDATVVVKNSSGVEQSATDGVYDLREGTYTYSVSKYGYETVEETITLTQDETLTIDLVKLPSNTVSFEITKPEDTGDVVITVTAKDGTVITAAEGGTYDLIAGEYSYLVTANGCNKVAADFTVTESDLSFTIALTIRTAWDGQTLTEPHTITAEEAVEDYAGMEGWYLITNGDELAWFANKVNTTSGGCTSSAVFAKDIDLGNEKWSPMGYNYSYYFAGTFDGMGHAIRGLYCDGTDNQGLFGYSKGTIRNLTVYGEVNGKGTYTGGIAAYQNGGSLTNCGSYVSVSSNYNGGEVGGIAGYAYGASFTACFNAGTLTGSKQQGGIAGVAYGTSNFTNCYNVGTMVKGENVTESSSSYAFSAGIVGLTNDYATVTLENCYNAGNVDSGYTRIGALVGQAGKSTTIRNSYYLNNVNKVCASYYSNEVPADISATACAAEEFKAVDMLDNLGSAYKADGTLDCAINDGYPVLSWQVIPVHTHTLTETPAEAATCTTEGNIAYWTCSVCEKIFSDAEGTNEITLADTVLPLADHSYAYADNGDGTHTATCTSGDDTYTEGHTFTDGTCVCGATEPVEDPYLVPELKFFNVSLNIQSYIGIDYTLYVSGKNSVVKNYDSFYTVFNIGGEEQTLYLADMNALTSTLYYYEITATASQMTENITATLYAVKDGVTYHGETVNYTIREGVMSNIAAYRAKETLTAKDIAGYTFAVDMLKYGANAQVRFNNLPDDLADSLLTEADLAYATSTVPALTETASYSGTADPVTYQRLTLSLGSRIEIQGMIKYNGASIDDLEVHVSYGGKDIVMPVTAYSKSYGLFNFNELPITDVRTEVTIVIYNKTTGTNASQVWTGSIAALAAELIAADPGNTDAINAMMRYGDSAYAYFNTK